MSLSIGDHLVIKRDGKIIGPKDEGHHEFEVMAMADPNVVSGNNLQPLTGEQIRATSLKMVNGGEITRDLYPEGTMFLVQGVTLRVVA